MQRYKMRPREAAAEAILTYVDRCGLRPGDRLPSEREMCEAWELNRCTLRSAVARLEQDGALTVKRNSGIFVAKPKFTRNLQDLNSFTQEARRQRRAAATRLLALETQECDKQFARRFQTVLGAPLWKLSRLRSLDGAPILIETAFLLQSRFPDLDRFDLERESLFAIFRSQYGAAPAQGEEKVSITQATAGEADLLGVEPGTPAYWIVSQTYDRSGALLEYCRTVARGDRLILTSILERREPT